MRNRALAADHLRRAAARLRGSRTRSTKPRVGPTVVRESQEVVELALKGLLRAAGVDPPRIHDVADVLESEKERLPPALKPDLPRLAAASRRLRRDRELAFYGADDLTPSEFYRREDAEEARAAARFVVERVLPEVIPDRDRPKIPQRLASDALPARAPLALVGVAERAAGAEELGADARLPAGGAG